MEKYLPKPPKGQSYGTGAWRFKEIYGMFIIRDHVYMMNTLFIPEDALKVLPDITANLMQTLTEKPTQAFVGFMFHISSGQSAPPKSPRGANFYVRVQCREMGLAVPATTKMGKSIDDWVRGGCMEAAVLERQGPVNVKFSLCSGKKSSPSAKDKIIGEQSFVFNVYEPEFENELALGGNLFNLKSCRWEL
jgi:hypothetical protein